MTLVNERDDLLQEARAQFREGKYKTSETILNQLVLNNEKSPEIFHMLATIYYDQGKFNKAIRSFKRALEIDPEFTDAAVGLSIILNDLGRYDEGKQIFEEARSRLDGKTARGDAFTNERLATKHDELGELYFQFKRYAEALEEYRKALKLSSRKAELTMKATDCLVKLEDLPAAIKELREIRREFPQFASAAIALGKIYYDSHRVPEAVAEWESVLQYDAHNAQVKDYLRLAQSVEVITLAENEL